MRIIDVGVCIDNIDPKGAGRIRVMAYSEYPSSKEHAIEYEKWGDTDPFIILPFLPLNINMIPDVGQAVKIISYSTSYHDINREYIAGPFSNTFDFTNQTFTKQLEDTTFGVAIQKSPDIFNKNGEYIKAESKGTLAKKNDFGLYGKYGSDIIFTENGINIRGGKLITKQATNASKSLDLLSFPIMGKKIANLSLKKFPKKQTLETKNIVTKTEESKDLKYLMEYEIDSLTSPKKINFYVYKIIKPYGNYTKTNTFTIHTAIPSEYLKLINTENNSYAPTQSIDILDVNNIHTVINNFIYVMHDNTLNDINTEYTTDDLHPFYYRPTRFLINLEPKTNTEQQFKNNLLSKILPYRNLSPENSLIWSKLNIMPKVDTEEKKIDFIKESNEYIEQTFASLKSDKIYLLSTDSNESDKNINFSILNKYELTQEDYVKNVDVNTYSMVRGENLLKILKLMLTVLFDHRHNLTKPMAKVGYDDYNKLVELIKNMENDILNNSIKIN